MNEMKKKNVIFLRAEAVLVYDVFHDSGLLTLWVLFLEGGKK